ncbi:MAG TPA: choice-of-anchor R domain-containing protein [Fibrobacteria bacterium]|nr:choice-of-anchor R domain-containing protein [Fibrobacteria bacterium]
MFIAHAGQAITHLGFRANAVTGAMPTYRISLQAINASGLPDGTVLGTGNNAFENFSSVTVGAWNWIALTNPYTPPSTGPICIVIDYVSGTIDASNFLAVNGDHSGLGGRINFPKAVYDISGTWSTRVEGPLWGYKTASAVYGFPAASVTDTQYSSNSNPNQRALKFIMPADTCSTYNVGYVDFIARSPAASKTLRVSIYSGTTELYGITFDTDVSTAASGSFRAWRIDFDAADVAANPLSAGTSYYVVFSPQETSHNFALPTFDFTAAADMAALPGGADWKLSTRNGGAWSDVDTSRPMVGIGVTGMYKGAGGGGGAIILRRG